MSRHSRRSKSIDDLGALKVSRGSDAPQVCSVCMETSKLIVAQVCGNEECGHQICVPCLSTYLEEEVKKGFGVVCKRIKCFGCKYTMSYVRWSLFANATTKAAYEKTAFNMLELKCSSCHNSGSLLPKRTATFDSHAGRATYLSLMEKRFPNEAKRSAEFERRFAEFVSAKTTANVFLKQWEELCVPTEIDKWKEGAIALLKEI